jgi:hypothetical protein
MHLKSEEYGAAKDALGTKPSRQAGYVIAGVREGNRIVGFADTGLQQSYSNLRWLVMVSQNAREALAAQRTVESFAILLVCVALLMVTLLAAYFFLHRKQEITDIESPTNGNHEPNHSDSMQAR